jgi:hypothetical protein
MDGQHQLSGLSAPDDRRPSGGQEPNGRQVGKARGVEQYQAGTRGFPPLLAPELLHRVCGLLGHRQ